MDDSPISLLMFLTLGAAIVLGGGAFMYFLRRRHNRRAATAVLVGQNGRSAGVEPDGAMPEIVVFVVMSLIAMGLLLLGYSAR